MNETAFIMNTKSIVHEIAKKNMRKCLGKMNELQQGGDAEISEWVEVFINLGTIREFLTGFFKEILVELG